MTENERLDQILVAAQSGFSVDALEFVSRGLDDIALAILLGNVSRLPVYMKSIDIPYLVLSRIAPSIETRKSPLSH
jgi:hypothetical protein